MNRKLLLLISVLLAGIVGTLGAQVLYHNWYNLGFQETEIFFKVTDQPHIGFAADTDKIHFGTVTQGQGSRREFIIRSQVPALAYISVSQNMVGLVFPENDTVAVEPGGHVRIQVHLELPRDIPVGNYTGTLRVAYLRRMPWHSFK